MKTPPKTPPKPPTNDHDAIMALWHMIVGSNGEGLMETVNRMRTRIFERIEEHEKKEVNKIATQVEQYLEKRRKNIWEKTKDLILIFVAVGSLVIAGLALTLGGPQ